jgi:hypothetical protein
MNREAGIVLTPYLIGLLVLGLAIQEIRVQWVKSEFKDYKAEIERQVAENKVKAAQEQARMAANATKALDDLQARLDSVNRSYRLLRDRRGSPAVPTLADAAGLAQSCPGESGKPNPAVGRMGILEAEIEGILRLGDSEIAKYVELWRLAQRNANPVLNSSP